MMDLLKNFYKQTLIKYFVGTFSSPQKMSNIQMKRPLLNSKAVHYHGDGSGRDSYIM